MTAQLLTNHSIARYYADDVGLVVPALSASIAKLLISRTPAHAKLAHPKLSPPKFRKQDPESVQVRGSVLHKLVLGRGAELCIVEADDWRTKAAQEVRDGAFEAGQLPVLGRRMSGLKASARAIVASLAEDWLTPLDGQSEVVVTWEETASDGTLVWCKAMLDHLRIVADGVQSPQCIDLKTLEDASPPSCEKQANEHAHGIQAAAYTSALSALYPAARSVDVLFAFAEAEPPNSVTLGKLDGEHLDLGLRQWRLAVDIWAECLTRGTWPSTYQRTVAQIRAKPWKLAEFEEREA